MSAIGDVSRGSVVKNLSDLSDVLVKLRRARNLEQSDMKMRIGMSQQQYQTIEAGGNTTIQTLLRVLEGLDAELLLVPKSKKISEQDNWFDGVKKFFEDGEIGKPTSPVGDEFAHLRDDDDI